MFRTRRRVLEGEIDPTLNKACRPGGTRTLPSAEEATPVAVACSEPPAGQARWTLQLQADQIVAQTDHDSVSIETIRRQLREVDLRPWRRRMRCIAKLTPEFIAQMKSMLELCADPPDLRRPSVCIAETLRQLLDHVVAPISAEPGKPVRIDVRYKRKGVPGSRSPWLPPTADGRFGSSSTGGTGRAPA